jgi:hypothetical protein
VHVRQALAITVRRYPLMFRGGMPERLNGAVLKTAGAAKPPGVRIPLPPHLSLRTRQFGHIPQERHYVGGPVGARASDVADRPVYTPPDGFVREM